MTKAITVDPREMRKSAVLTGPKIPINAYSPNSKKEAKKYGKDALVKMYRDMAYIREFESMLDRIKKENAYQGIEYNHKGPAHLSIGQESAAVGQAYHLTADDFIFGSHRSHGEILAKSFSAIDKMDDDELIGFEVKSMTTIMRAVEDLGSVGLADPVAVKDSDGGDVQLRVIVRCAIVPEPEEPVTGKNFEELQSHTEGLTITKRDLCPD